MAPEPTGFTAGDIVLADWRGGARPSEPTKLRPAVVVEDSGLFGPGYLNVILIPLTNDGALVIQDLSVPIAPTAENGCTKPCWAAAHLVTTACKSRLHPTASRVTGAQLTAMRRCIAEAIGIQA